MTTWADLEKLDARLARKGHHPLTPWWREQLRAFYQGGARTLVARVGRGGTKSTTTVKVALGEVLFGAWQVPPGEVHWWAHVAENVTEAASRLRLFTSYCDALGIKYDATTDTAILRNSPLGYRVLPARIGGVSGFRCVGFTADEAAKWKAGDSTANPAREVVASLKAMTVTHAAAKSLVVSSPFGTDDYHAELVTAGTSATTMVCCAATWVANPMVTEQQTRDLEPDPRIWSREYEAIPSTSAGATLDPEQVRACFRPRPDGLVLGQAVVVLDPAGAGGDSFAFGAFSWGWRVKAGAPTMWWMRDSDGRLYEKPAPHDREPPWQTYDTGGRPTWRKSRPEVEDLEQDPTALVMLEVDSVTGVSGADGVKHVFDRIGAMGSRHGARSAFGDQRDALACYAECSRRGLKYDSIPWTNEGKRGAVDVLRDWLRRGVLILPENDRLRREMIALETKITPSGYEVTAARRRGHDDHAALVLTAAMAETAGLLPMSPHRPKGPTRGTVYLGHKGV